MSWRRSASTNVTYDLQNANGDPNTAKQIAIKFKSDKVNVAVGIATPTSQALASTIDRISRWSIRR